jgi:hypothetical protein
MKRFFLIAAAACLASTSALAAAGKVTVYRDNDYNGGVVGTARCQTPCGDQLKRYAERKFNQFLGLQSAKITVIRADGTRSLVRAWREELLDSGGSGGVSSFSTGARGIDDGTRLKSN